MRFLSTALRARFRSHSTVSGRHRLPTRPHGHATTTVNVGGVNHVIFDEDLAKHPASMLAQMVINYKQNAPDPAVPIHIERDGSLFKHVNAFLMNGHVSQDLDTATLHALKEEATYYDIKTLKAECNHVKIPSSFSLDSYLALKKDAILFKDDELECEAVDLISVESEVWSEILRGSTSSCISGDAHFLTIGQRERVYAAVAHMVPAKKKTTELGASELSAHVLEQAVLRDYHLSQLDPLSPENALSMTFRKVVINRRGGKFTIGPLENNLVGTLVIVMGEDETEDTFQVTRGADEVHVTTVAPWVAIDCNCTLTVAPVAAGTRVLMVYDIHDVENADTGAIRSTLPNINRRGCTDNTLWRSGYRGLAYQTETAHSFTRFSAARKQQLYNAMNKELRTAASVTVGMRDVYIDGRESLQYLQGSDRALYDLLCEQYKVELVSVLVHEHVRETKAAFLPTKQPGKSARSRTPKKHKLVLPYKMTARHELHFVEECICWDPWDGGGHSQEAVFVVSGLRVSKKK